MPTTIDQSTQLAKYLLEISAVKLSPRNPFTWASGWKSPIYCDNRISLSYPEIRTFIKEQLAQTINDKYPEAEKIAGVATAGISHGALVADELNLPFAYVRSKPKEHGMGNMIEGKVDAHEKIVVIEDLISTGKSSIAAIKALKEQGCDILGMGAIFTYGFEIAKQNFKEIDCSFFTLSNYDILIEEALISGYINQEDLDSLKSWRKSPETWGR